MTSRALDCCDGAEQALVVDSANPDFGADARVAP